MGYEIYNIKKLTISNQRLQRGYPSKFHYSYTEAIGLPAEPLKHETATSSECPQLWTPHSPCEHWKILFSVPLQWTSSKPISPFPTP